MYDSTFRIRSPAIAGEPRDITQYYYAINAKNGARLFNTGQKLRKCWDKRPGRIIVNSEDTIMLIHAQKASRY